MSSGLYTVFDCLTEGIPFAARLLHEVVHHWAQGARELATFGAGDELVLGLNFLRRTGVEQSIPWRKHSRASVQVLLDNLQASWVNDSDLSPEDVAAQGSSMEILESLLASEAALLTGDALQTAIQVWTFRPREVLRALANGAQRLISAGVDVTVVTLNQAERTGNAAVPGVKEVCVAGTKSAVLRFLRKRLLVQISLDLQLPQTLTAPVAWALGDVHMESEPCFKTVRCMCSPVIFMVPGQQEAATARLARCEFYFRRLVKREGIEAWHLYGVPLVVHADEKPGLATRLMDRQNSPLDFGSFTEHLAQGVAALYVSKAKIGWLHHLSLMFVTGRLGNFLQLDLKPRSQDGSVMAFTGSMWRMMQLATSSVPTPWIAYV
ncbi:unnamed protein product [Effrenium voratum]|nr:unnamed protein product [Effrenium voratum]